MRFKNVIRFTSLLILGIGCKSLSVDNLEALEEDTIPQEIETSLPEKAVTGLNFGEQGAICFNLSDGLISLKVSTNKLRDFFLLENTLLKKEDFNGLEYLMESKNGSVSLNLSEAAKDQFKSYVEEANETSSYQLRKKTILPSLKKCFDVQNKLKVSNEHPSVLISSDIQINHNKSSLIHRGNCKYKKIENENVTNYFLGNRLKGEKFKNPFLFNTPKEQLGHLHAFMVELHKTYFNNQTPFSALEFLMNSDVEFLYERMYWSTEIGTIKIQVTDTNENGQISAFYITHSFMGKILEEYPLSLKYD